MILLNNIRNQRRFFDLFSESYDFIEFLTFGFANRIRKRSLTILNPLRNDIICDLMCGSGQNIGILSPPTTELL